MVGPRPLSFDDTPSPKKEQKVEPKPLSLDGMPSNQKKQPDDRPSPKALSLENVHVPVKPAKVERSPKSLFDDGSGATVQTAIKLIEDRFPNLKPHLDQVERQVRTLIPLKLEVAMNWAAPALESQVQLTASAAAFLKTYTDLKSTDRLDEATKAISQRGNFFTKMFGSKGDLATLKVEVSRVKTSLQALIPQNDDMLKKMIESERRLTIQYASLIAVKDTLGASVENSIENAIFNRSVLLQQSLQQNKLLQLRINETSKILLDQVERVDHLILVAIPAFEASQGK